MLEQIIIRGMISVTKAREQVSRATNLRKAVVIPSSLPSFIYDLMKGLMFLEEVKIYQKRSKLVKSLIIGLYTILLWLLFLAVGIYNHSLVLIMITSVGLLITLYCYVIIVYHFIKPKVILTVNEQGIIDHTTIPTIGPIAWEEIDQIYTAKVLKKTSIYIKLKDVNKMYARFPKWKALFIKLNTPKNADPVMINLQKTDADISEVFDLLKTGLRDYRATLS